jgi:hypothetical protein
MSAAAQSWVQQQQQQHTKVQTLVLHIHSSIAFVFLQV